MVNKFEDLNVWQDSMKLNESLYKLLMTTTDFGLRDQMQRAAVSIPSNIAEGYDRDSNKDFIRFLNISRGSCAELRTQLQLAINLKIVDVTVGNELLNENRKISAMLFKLIKTRKEKF